ncbi:MAG TPA: hypothetical protein VI094_08000 [Propionibacteriaceae bacterium]
MIPQAMACAAIAGLPVADLRAQGLEIWVVLPRGEAAEAISRFRDVFGPAEVQPFPTISDAIEAHLDQLDGSTD